MRLKVAAIMMAVIAISAAFGASAYTTGSIDRSSTVDVVTDTNGLIGLTDGNSGDLVYTSGGKLTIDFSNAGISASGVNPDANFTLGNASAPTTTYAFTMTNQDSVAHDLTLSYTASDNTVTGDGTDNIKFLVYDSTGSSLGTASEETALDLTSTASAATVYVVVVIDTTGLTDTNNLSGTLKVSA